MIRKRERKRDRGTKGSRESKYTTGLTANERKKNEIKNGRQVYDWIEYEREKEE